MCIVLGKLIGLYYDSSGKETDYAKVVYEKIELGKVNKLAKKKENDRYPSCNVEYIQENQRSKIWCTELRLDVWILLICFDFKCLVYNFCSGGVKRKWIGVPRKLQILDKNGILSVRCACVQIDELSKVELAHIVEYDDCDANSNTCYVKVS